MVRFQRLLQPAAAALTLLAACSTAGPAQQAMDESVAPLTAATKPNILFIQIDDLRTDLGIYGHPIAQTPNLDALGRSGIVFDNAITQQALCAPSRAALMTAIRPETSGIIDLDLTVDEALPDVITMLDLFKGNGYQTLGYGKIYHHIRDDADGWTKRTQDFDHIARREAQERGEPRLSTGRALDRAALPDTRNVALAINDLRALSESGEPFFMAVGLHRPHLPFIAPAEDWDRYDRATIPGPVNPKGQQGAPPWAVVAFDLWNYEDNKPYEETKILPQDKADELRHAYLASVSYVDSLVGELMQGLSDAGLKDNTIVVVWSDHGYKLGDQGGWSKHSNVNLDIRIPFMISAPGKIARGLRSDAIVETVDVYPTLAEMAGLTTPDHVEGYSMAPLLSNPDLPWKKAAFAQYPRWPKGEGRAMGHTVRSKAFRYTVWVSDRTGNILAQELYDLRIDPTESRNVAAEPQYALDLKRLEQLRLDGWRAALPKSRK